MNTQSITFRRMQAHFTYTLISIGMATLICGTSIAQTKQENVSPSSVAADRAYEELMSATTYLELEQMIVRWNKELNDQAKVKLVRVLQSKVLRNDPEPRLLTPLGDGDVSGRHDLTIPADRAVWAIERLFGVSLPVVKSEVSSELWNEIYSTLASVVDKWAREKVKKRLSEMPKSKRLEQARSPKPLIYPEETLIILDLLADDSDTEIRMEILGTPWPQYHTMKRRLEEEQDAEIKKKLEPFKHRAFIVPRNLPKPEGW